MSIRLHRMCRAAISVALVVAASSFARAKPPDLPTESREAVAPQAGSQEIEIIEEEQEAKPIAAEQLTVMPVQVERIPFMPTEVPSNDEEEDKNIVVPVNELPTGSLLFGIGVNSDAGLVGSTKAPQTKKGTSSMPARVGEVIILGNERTSDRIIRVAVAIYPGEVLSYPKLCQAQRNLEKLGVFVVDRRKGIRPTVTILERDDSEYKDILVQVQERATDRGAEEASASLPPSSLAPSNSHQAAARRMFLIGERCRQKGDLDMAANCYQETHLLCPECSYGRKAIARLHEIEERRAAEGVPSEAEEPEAPKPDNAPPDFDTSRRPLPSLPDADVFRDLEALLNQIADAKTAKLLTEAGTGEEQEVPATTAPPTLLVPLPPKDLTIHVDEPETYGATSSLLQQAGDVLETVTALDIDIEFASARSGAGLRAQGSIMLGAVGYKVTYSDNDGHATLEVVPSRP